LIATPGHTPGHQSLLVKLPNTGAILLSGDAAHFKDNWDNRRVPGINFNKEQTLSSMERMAALIQKSNVTLWINHDQPQTSGLKRSPAYYD
jgi:glyoxylase-like metal-dependent hydrolase (beta-lactamase superfamily II)